MFANERTKWDFTEERYEMISKSHLEHYKACPMLFTREQRQCIEYSSSRLMNHYLGHQFLYDYVLSVVNPAYEEVEYNWSNIIVKPEDLS